MFTRHKNLTEFKSLSALWTLTKALLNGSFFAGYTPKRRPIGPMRPSHKFNLRSLCVTQFFWFWWLGLSICLYYLIPISNLWPIYELSPPWLMSSTEMTKKKLIHLLPLRLYKVPKTWLKVPSAIMKTVRKSNNDAVVIAPLLKKREESRHSKLGFKSEAFFLVWKH